MAGGTDIYIISGAVKRPQPQMVVLYFMNGGNTQLPFDAFKTLVTTYGANRARIGSTPITADSTPDYDEWGPDEWWTCADWKQWHVLNVQKYGQAVANDKFMQAWAQQDSFMSPYNWCKYDADFAGYFKNQGIDVGWLLSHLIVGVENVGDNVINTSENLGDTVESVSEWVKVAAGLAFIGAGIYAIDRWVIPAIKRN